MLPVGSFVVVKRAKGFEWYGMKSAGPYIVLADLGERARIMALATGRIDVEAKTNLRLLRGWVQLEKEPPGIRVGDHAPATPP